MKVTDSLIVFLLLFSSQAVAQQTLWTTLEDTTSDDQFVPLNEVPNEVLKIYDQYDYYFDLSGYSKKRFISEMDYGFDDWAWLNEVNETTVFALRSNTGRGSMVLILIVSKENVNMLMFSNDITLHSNAQGCYSSNKSRFREWFDTLMN